MTESAFIPLLGQVANGQHLAQEQAERAFQIIMSGGASPAQIAAFLVALRMKGETVGEITAGANAIRVKAARFNAAAPCMDTCGTGGDGSGSLNISTAVGLVLAACGVRVAKHGNRAVSSRCGSADVLAELGVRIDAEAAVMEKCLREANFCFLFAPLYHKAMRHVAPVRQELKLRTVFNLLGPLANPAKPAFQLLGVYGPEWVEKMANVLAALGVQRALVVHGLDGTDELSLAGPTLAAELNNGAVTTYEINPSDARLPKAPAEALKGGDAHTNAQALRALLTGERSAYHDAVVYNAAAGLVIAGKAADLVEGAEMAALALASGAANGVLQNVIVLSRMQAPVHA